MASRLRILIPENTLIEQIAKFIGIVTALGVIVIAFCTLFMELDTKDTAAATCFTILISTVMLLGPRIDHIIKSSWLAMLLIILFSVFYYGYRYIIKKNTGLIKYWKVSKDILPTVREDLIKAETEVLLYGANFHISSLDQQKEIIDQLKKGRRIRYLVYYPYSENIDMIAKDFHQTTAAYKSECISGLKNIILLQNVWDNTNTLERKGELQVRLYSAMPRMRAYIFDPSNPQSECFFIPYVHEINSPDLPAFEFRNMKDGVFNDYYSSIVRLWNVSKDLNELAKTDTNISKLFKEM